MGQERLPGLFVVLNSSEWVCSVQEALDWDLTSATCQIVNHEKST